MSEADSNNDYVARFDSLPKLRAEQTKLYDEAKAGLMRTSEARDLAMMLSTVRRTLIAESDEKFREQEIAAIKDLAERIQDPRLLLARPTLNVTFSSNHGPVIDAEIVEDSKAIQ